MKKYLHTLHGLRILNTRPLPEGRLLSQAITDAGGISIDLPTIVIEPTPTAWLERLPDLSKVQQAIFISINAINCFYHTLQQHHLRWPDPIQITVIGQGSARALKKWNVTAHHIPQIADSEHLLELEVLKAVAGQTILLIKGEGGRIDITNTLLKRGANLVLVEVYRRMLPNLAHDMLTSLRHERCVDIIVFTSLEAIQNLFLLMGKASHAWLCKVPCLVISQRLADAAAILGMHNIIVCDYKTILDALKLYRKG